MIGSAGRAAQLDLGCVHRIFWGWSHACYCYTGIEVP